jgi:hypothetical protein
MSEHDDEFFGRDKDPVDGMDGHVVLPPDELVMMAEEIDTDSSEEWGVGEVFRRVLCFVFYDARCSERLGWDYAAAALEVLYREFCPCFLLTCGAERSSRRKGLGLVSGSGRGVDEMVREVPADLLESVLSRMARSLEGDLWLVELTRRFYAVAKLLDEDLIGGISLARMGDVFGESNQAAARARWSARVHQVLREVGGPAACTVHGRYMKSDSARQKMSASALGNRNRAINQHTQKNEL